MRLSAKQVERFMRSLKKQGIHRIKAETVLFSGVRLTTAHVFYWIKTGRSLSGKERLLKTCSVKNCISCRKKMTHSQLSKIVGRRDKKKR